MELNDMSRESKALSRANKMIRMHEEAYDDACIDTHDLVQALIHIHRTTSDEETMYFAETVLNDHDVTIQ